MSPEPPHKGDSAEAHIIGSKLGSISAQSIQTQRTQQHIMLSRLEKRALNSLKLVEKVESIGLQNIISTPSNALNQLSFGIAYCTLNRTSSAKIGELHIDRDQMKGVLNRGGLTISGSKYKCDKTNCVKNKMNIKEDYFINDNKAIELKQLHRTQHISPQFSSLQNHLNRQKIRREIKNNISLQRPDLGTIVSLGENDLGRSPHINNHLCVDTISKIEFKQQESQTNTQSFVGSVSSLLFGRKGGWF